MTALINIKNELRIFGKIKYIYENRWYRDYLRKYISYEMNRTQSTKNHK